MPTSDVKVEAPSQNGEDRLPPTVLEGENGSPAGTADSTVIDRRAAVPQRGLNGQEPFSPEPRTQRSNDRRGRGSAARTQRPRAVQSA